MLKHIFNLATLSVMCGCVVILFIVALSAMLSGGKIILDFNMFNEGWIEVFMLGFFIIPSIIHISKATTISSIDYCKRNKVK